MGDTGGGEGGGGEGGGGGCVVEQESMLSLYCHSVFSAGQHEKLLSPQRLSGPQHKPGPQCAPATSPHASPRPAKL